MKTESSKTKLEPHHVKALLNRDVAAILRTCIHHFEEVEQEIEDKFFDVDGIVAGRPSREQQASIRRSARASKHYVPAATPTVLNPYHLRVPARGNFIPKYAFA